MGVAERYEQKKKNTKNAAYSGVEYRYRTKQFENEREELASRINAWAEDNNRLADSYKQRFEGREAGKYVSDSGEWLQVLEEQGAKSDAEAASIRERLDYYKDFIDADWSKGVLDQLDLGSKFRSDVFDEATADHEYWSKWDSEEAWKKDYDAAVAWQKDYDEKMSYDLVAGQAEIDRLQGEIDKLRNDWETNYAPGIENTQRALAELRVEKNKLKGRMDPASKAKMAEIDKKIAACEGAINKALAQDPTARIRELEGSISSKTQYYTLAKRVQDAAKLAGVADRESEYYDPEFDKYTGYVNTLQDGKVDPHDLIYEYINADDARRQELVDDYAGYSPSSLYNTYFNSKENYMVENVVKKGYNQLKEEEKAIYNYYYQKHGKEAAEEYLFSIADTLNVRQAGVVFDNVNDHVALEYLFGVYAGLDQFETGMENLFNGDDYIPTNSTQLASGMVREDLKDNGIPLWYNFKDKKWEKEILGSSSGQIFYDAINTTSNMLPSILASAGANMILPGSGSYVGSALLGASAAGNAKAEMLNLGYSKEQANAYGLMVGASEAVLEKVLGGIPGLKGGDGIFSALGQKALGKIDNALARVAITIGGNMLDEGLEEGIQTILEPWLAEIATKVDWEDPTVDEVLYSSLLGALSSIGFTGAGMVSSSIASNQNAKALFGEYAPELINRALEVGDPKVKALAESYQKKLDAGKTLSGSELNKLAQSVTRSTQKTGADTKSDGAASDPFQSLAIELRAARASRKESYATENPAGKKSAVKTEFEASADGKTIYHSERGDVETSVMEIVSVEDGKITVRLENGETVDASKISFSSSDDAALYGSILDMGINGAVANAFINGYDKNSGMSIEQYARGFQEAYTYGAYGYSESEMSRSSGFSPLLSEWQRMLAYRAGQIFGNKVSFKKSLQNGTDSGTMDISALLAYKSGGSYSLNAKLRDGTELDEYEREIVSGLDKALEKLPVYEGKVYRNIQFDGFGDAAARDAFVAGHIVGDIVRYPAYTSTSTDIEGYPLEGEFVVHFVIESTNGRNVAGYGNNFESEVLFPRNTIFVTDNITYDQDGTPTIYLTEVTNEQGTVSTGRNQETLSVDHRGQPKASSESDTAKVQRLSAQDTENIEMQPSLSERNSGRDISRGTELQGVQTEINEKTSPDGKVVYSSKKAKAVDAVPVSKYDSGQKHVALIGLQIGRKVVYAKTMNQDGVEVDGFLGTDGVIYINPNNPNPLAFVFKHELAHFCERAGQKYQDFIHAVAGSKTFKNWIRDKGFKKQLEYNAQIRRERSEIGQNLDEYEANREIMANFVGEVLFGNNTELAERIISELEPKPRKTFVDYIRDFISWLKRKLHGDSSRARNEIQKLESKFASAYQAALKNGANNRESFSISQSLESELDKLLKGTFDASRNEIYLGETSNFMTDVIGAQALHLYMPASKAYSALVTEEEYNKKPYYSKQDNYHGIGKADFMEILEKSETPIAAFAASSDEKGNKRRNRIILVTDKLIRDAQNGKNGYAVVVEEVDAKGLRNGKRINANKAITIYPRTQLLKDIQDAIIDGRILDITKKGEHLFAGVRGSNPQAAIRKDVLKKNIAHFWENVKWESEKNKTFSSTETPTLTPMQAAFMKAGYIDQNGHNKYMQESEESSQKDGDEQFSYTPVDPAEWLERYEKGEISREEYLEGMNKKPKKENPVTIASLTPEDMKTTPELAKKTGEAKGDGESRFHGSLQRSSIFDEKFKEEAKKDNFIKHYSAITNEDTLKEAARLLDEGGEAYVEAWKNKRTVEMSTVDTVVGFILLKRYQEVGNYEGAMAVAQKVREVGTLSGQRVQAFSIIGRYDADMMQAYAQKELAEAWEKAVIGKSEKWSATHKAQFELTDEEIAFIRDNILYAAKLPEGSREKAIALAEITTLIQNKIPPVKGQSYKAWQRVSMLLNPKTQIRNILGNAVMVPVFVASDWFSAPLDMALSRITGVRTTGLTGTRGNRENLKAMGRGLFESYDDWKRHINTRQHDLNRFEIGQGKSFDETKWGRIAKMMNSADRFTSFLLDAGDRTFYEMWFTNSLNNQMRLNKVSEPTEAMVQAAIDEALERTWQDDNVMTKMVGNIKAGANKISIGGYGLGDVLIKFSKTPANLTKAIYDFSPAAIATLVPQAVTLTRAINNGTVTPAMQKRFVSSFGKMAAGMMLYVVFAALYNAGRISGASDEDDDVAAFEKYIQGIPEYSVKIGNKWFSYDWAQPIGAVPAVIADFMESKKEGDSAIDGIIGAFKAGGEVLFNQSFMTSFQTLFAADSFAEGFLDITLGEVTVPIPTLFSQVANAFDDKRRVTYDNTSEWQSAINRAISKFPGLRNTLVAEVDIFGREVENSQQDWFNAFFNPANVYTDTSSEVSDHVYEIYKSTGDASAIPAKAPYSVDLQGVKKKLNDSERAEYQKAMGATASEMIEALLENDVYLAMNDEYKLAVLKTVYSYAAKVAKSELDWHESFEVVHGISEHVTKSDFEAMSEDERIKIVDDYLFSDYNGMYNIETDEGKANYFVNQKTPGAVLTATMNGDIDAAKKLLNGIDERVKSYGWDKVDTEAEIKERKSTVKRTLTTYWKAAYINAYYKKNDAEMEKIRKLLIEIGLYGKSSDVRKTLREWIEAYEEEN